MARDLNDPGTIELDLGDPELNDPDYESKAGGDSVSATTEAAPAGGAQQDSATPAQGADGQGSDTGGDQTGASSGGASAAQADDGQRQRVGAVKADDKGNLVDAAGNVIAAAGAERRHYERVQQQDRYIRRIEGELAEARTAATLTGVLNGVPARLGLDARETELGLQIMSSFKKDPVATARWALQQTMQMGYNLAQIVGEAPGGQPVGGSLDLQAVQGMIQKALAPLIGDRDAAAQQTQIEQAAQRDFDAFIAKHENAAVHDDVLASMLRSDDALTPEAAYWQLVAYAARNQLDFTQPLRPQVLARRGQPQAPNGNAQPSSAQGQQHQQAMPNGVAPTSNMQTEADLASPDTSWDEIVQSSLHAAGWTN